MKKIILLIFALIFLTSISYSQELIFDISLGIKSEWKLERFLPLFIDIYNPGNRITLNIEAIYNQGLRYAGYCETVYQENIEIPPLSNKKIEFLIPPIDFRYPLRLRIWHNNKLIREEKIDISLERIVLPLILILGKNIPSLPFSEKARILRIYDEKFLPLNYKAYDNFDLILIERAFWDKLPTNLKNSITMYKILTGRVYFTDEVKKIPLELLKIPPVNITIPHNTILYTPDISLLQGQKFLYPDRFIITAALIIYFISLFLWKNFLFKRDFLLLLFLQLFPYFLSLDFRLKIPLKKMLLRWEKNPLYTSIQILSLGKIILMFLSSPPLKGTSPLIIRLISFSFTTLTTSLKRVKYPFLLIGKKTREKLS